MFDGLHDFICSPVPVSGQIEGATTKGVDERPCFLVCVHGMYVLTKFTFDDHGMERVNSFDVVWDEIQEEGFAVL
jgi:hypothetical protein